MTKKDYAPFIKQIAGVIREYCDPLKARITSLEADNKSLTELVSELESKLEKRA